MVALNLSTGRFSDSVLQAGWLYAILLKELRSKAQKLAPLTKQTNHKTLMKNKNSAPSDHIAVVVSRFGSDPIAVSVPTGSTVSDVLVKAGIDLMGTEEVFVAGEKADSDAEVEDKDILSVVTPKQAGAR